MKQKNNSVSRWIPSKSALITLLCVLSFTCWSQSSPPIILTVAGNGNYGFSGNGGPATAAELDAVYGVAVDASGNIYIPVSGNTQRVQIVNSSGIISTLAGNGKAGYSGDGGPAAAAEFNNPYDVAVDASGNVYISDENNNRIRKVNTSGIVSTFAGTGIAGYSGDGVPATATDLSLPGGIALDASGNLYIADRSNYRVRKVNGSGIMSTVAGNGNGGYSGDGGLATAAEVNGVYGVAADASGNVYIADESNHRIRVVNSSGIINTLAGNGYTGYTGDGGLATAASLNEPYGVAADASGNVYIADEGSNTVRIVNSSGVINTLAGTGNQGFSGDGGPATAAQLSDPYAVAVSTSGKVYIADLYNYRIREVTNIFNVSGSVSANISCNGGNGGSASVTPYHGTSPYVYSWSPAGGNNSTASGLTAGTYTITLTDNGDSTASTTVIITQPNVLSVRATIVSSNACTGGGIGNAEAVISGGNSPYNYSWSTGSTTASTGTILSVGTYTVTVTDNCSASASTTVVMSSSPLRDSIVAASIVNLLCNGAATGSAEAGVKGGAVPYTFLWSDGGGSNATINSSYLSGSKTFSYTGAIQNYAIPAGVTQVTISVTGAAGGAGASATYLAGDGASFTGVSTVTPGHVLSVVVGGLGDPGYNSSQSGGGGGASWVYDSTLTGAHAGTPSLSALIAVAAGGGGGSYYNPGSYGGAGGTNLTTSATTNGEHGNSPGGVGGNGGESTTSSGGGGGAGWLSNGLTEGGGNPGGGGNDWTNSFAAAAGYVGANGGFGGGGGGGGEGGGGGGYNGGGGGLVGVGGGEGGGGGSFFNTAYGSLPANAIATNTGNGSVTISYLVGNPAGLIAGTYSVNVTDYNGCTATASVNITQPNALRDSIVRASVVNVACNGQSTGNATVGVKYGTLPYTYSWSGGGGNNSTANDISAGVYTVTVEDNCGATVTSTVTITQPTPLAITASVISSNACSGNGEGDAQAFATGGSSPYTYSWSNGATTAATGTVLHAGTYTVTVHDKCGASLSTTVVMTSSALRDSIVAASIVDIRCRGAATGTATVGVKGGISPYTYSWSSNGGTDADLTTNYSSTTQTFSYTGAIQNFIVPTGITQLTVTVIGGAGGDGNSTTTYLGGNGAGFTGVATVTPGHIIGVVAGGQGVNGVIENDGGGGGGGSYVWDLNTNTLLAVAGGGGGAAYDATGGGPGGTDLVGNSATNGAGANAAGGTGGNGGGVSNGAGGAGWLGNGENTGSDGGNDYANGFTGGSGDDNGGFGGGGAGAASGGGGGGGYNGGGGGNSSEPGGGGGSYFNTAYGSLPGTVTATNTGNGSITISYSRLSGVAGTYSVTVTDNNGCTTTTSVTLTQPGVLRDSIAATSNVYCNGNNGSATVGVKYGTAPYTYSWSNGGANATISGLSAGSYNVSVQDNCGVSVTASATITQPASLSITASVNSSNACGGGGEGNAYVVATGGNSPYTYSWSTGSTTTSTGSVLNAGTYTVTVRDICGASVSAAVIMPSSGLRDSIVAASTVNIRCNGGTTGSATVGAKGGASPYTYLWSLGGGANATIDSYNINGTQNFSYSGAIQHFIVPPGVSQVTINVTGAAGAFDAGNVTAGGAGASFTGVASVTAGHILSVVVGGQTLAPSAGNGSGGGGGASWVYDSTIQPGHSGIPSLSALIAVAAGGGGAAAGYEYPGAAGGTDLIGNSTTNATGGIGSAAGGTGGNGGAGGGNLGFYNAAGGGGAGWLSNGGTSEGTPGGNDWTNSFAIVPGEYGGNGGFGGGGSTGYNGGGGGGGYNGGGAGQQDGGGGGGGGGSFFNTAYGSLPTNVTATNTGNGSVSISYSANTGLLADTYTVTVTDHNGCTVTASINMTQPAALSATASATTNINCYGQNDGIASVMASNGTSPYTYSWLGGEGNNSTASGLSAGVYSVTVGDNCGESVTASVTMTQPSAVIAPTTTFTGPTCRGGSNGSASASEPSSIGGSQTFSYSGAIQHFTVPAGVIQVSISITGAGGGEDDNGIGAGAGASFTGVCSVNPGHVLSVAVGQAGGNDSPGSSDGGGGGGASWVYDSTAQPGHSGNPSLSDLLAVAAGGGGAGYNDAPGGAGGTDLAGNTTTNGGNGSSPGGVGGGGGQGGQNPDGTPNSCGGAGGGGWFSAGQTDDSPYADGGNDWTNSFASVAGVTGGMGGFGGGGGDAGCGSGGGGGYNGGGGGYANASGGGGGGSYLNGTVIGSPLATNSGNGSVTISYPAVSAGAYSYSWSPGGKTTSTISGLAAGTYTVTAHNACGASASATVIVTQPNPLTVSASTIIGLCSGSNTGNALASPSGGTSPFTYAWSTGATTSATGAVLSVGTYSVTVHDACGNSASSSVVIQQSSPLSATTSVTTPIECIGTNTGVADVGVTGGISPYTYSWSNGGGTNATLNNFSTSGSQSFSYSGSYPYNTGTIETFTVPAGVTQISVTIAGGAGGAGNNNVIQSNNYVGGNGAGFSGIATVIPGHVLGIVAGSDGNSGSANEAPGGGGGGSYVWDENTTTLIAVAGGGGGAGTTISGGGAGGTNLTTNAPTFGAGGPGSDAAGGTNGGGGGANGGAGWLGNGATGNGASGGGDDMANGFIGGAGYGGQGGFGGGGGGQYSGGGGGGGYNGGGGGLDDEPGGGGGSYFNGTVIGLPVANNIGEGSVTLAYSVLSQTGVPIGTYTVTVTDNNGCTTTASVTVTQPALLSATTSTITNVSCNGGNNGSASITASNGASPYTYLWSPGGETNSTATGLSAGGYSVTVTDNCGASVPATVIITQPIAARAPVIGSITNVTCNGGSNGSASVSEGVLPADTLSFSYTGTIQNFTVPTGVTQLSITVTGAAGGVGSNPAYYVGGDGASFTGVTTVTPDDVLGIVAGGQGEGGNSGSGGGGGGGGGSYVWDENTTTLLIVAGGGGGSGSEQTGDAGGGIDLVGNSATNSDYNGNAANGVNGNGGNDGGFYGGGGGAGWLSDGANGGGSGAPGGGGNDRADGFTGGIGYENGGYGGGGGGSTPGGGGGGGYNGGGGGSDNDGNGSGGGGGGSYFNTAYGVLPTNATATNAGNGSVTIIYYPSAIGTYSYTWSPGGQTGSSVSGLTAGTYTVSVNDNCGGTATTAVTITQPNTLSVFAGRVNGACNSTSNGNAVAFPSGGTAPFTYSWSTGSTLNPTGAILSTGTYSVTVQDSCGNLATASIFIEQSTPMSATASVTTPILCYEGNAGVAQAGATGGITPYSYSWSTGGGTNATINSYTLANTQNFSFEAAVQTFTIPLGVTQVSITLTGGAGGDGNNTTTRLGGNGAGFTGVATVTAGHVLGIVTGGLGVNGVSTDDGAGGGGGSYVWDENTTTLIAAAGGGGGAAYNVTGGGAGGTNLTTSAATNGASGPSGTELGGVNGNGGASGGTGGSGAGWLSNGGSGNGTGGNDRANGFTAGTGGGDAGGFGGGGGGGYNGGGGGGGYNGGGGANGDNPGGGGGSYFNTAYGSLPTNVTATNTGNGSVAISYEVIGNTGIIAGTYSVTVTDNNGCTATASVILTQPTTPLSATASILNPGCGNNAQVEVTASNGTSPYTYSWSNGSTDSTASGLSAGGYNVIVTDNCGAAVTATVIISQSAPLLITASVTSPNVCSGVGLGNGQVVASGGSSPYTYSWSTGSTADSTGTILSGGTYTVTVMDNCGESGSANVVMASSALIDSIVAASTVNITCNGAATGSATVGVAGGVSPYIYSWSNGSTSSLAGDTLRAGTYLVSVTDNNGCTVTASVTITQPYPLSDSISSVSEPCSSGGNSGSATVGANYGTPPYTYSWSNNRGNNATAIGLGVGTYTVTVMDNCGASAVATIAITQPPSLTTTASIVSSNACTGIGNGSAQAYPSGGTSPYIYSWSNGSTSNPTGSVLSAGTYTVTVTDNCGSTSTASVVMISSPLRDSIVTASIVNVRCNGGFTGTATVGVDGGATPYTYAWSSGGGSDAGLTANYINANVTFSYTGTIQNITLPASVTQVTISVTGAAGGTGDAGYLGGYGASFTGIANVTGGHVLSVVVGGMGGTNNHNGGGGGGSWVYDSTLTGGHTGTPSLSALLAVAAGGGGGSYDNSGIDGGSGGTDLIGNTTTNDLTLNAAGGIGGNGGAVPGPGSSGASGAGWLSNGGAVSGSTGGNDWANHFAIAMGTLANPGGFGGGGSGGDNNGAGGGGGYNGGGGGFEGEGGAGGGGGGSFFNTAYGSLPTNAVDTNTGNGSVTISYLILSGTAGAYSVTVTDANGCTATAGVTLTQPNALTTTVSQTAISCHGENTGTASAIPSDGTSPYTYSWSGGAGNSSNVSGLRAGTYSVTVLDNCGASATASTIITQPTALSAATSIISTNSCSGVGAGNAKVFATGGGSPYTYSWSNGITTDSTGATLTGGVYTVTVHDNCGASATGAIVIPASSLRDSIIEASKVNVLCNGTATGTATVGVKGGVSPYTYAWSSGGGSDASLTSNYISGSQTFSYEPAIQHFTVPAGISQVSVTVSGAQGGGNGGLGASFTGICTVTPGQIISVAVGEQGGTTDESGGNGGGGGSFVYDSNTVTLLAVGAGGGGNDVGDAGAGAGGTDLTGNSTTTGMSSNSSFDQPGGTGGNGGSGGTVGASPGGGGAGWLSNGTNSSAGQGGMDRANGFTGGTYSNGDGSEIGGYGGGGAGGGDGGGGGGGYNGGGGGNKETAGGGGGSFFNTAYGSLPTNVTATNTGNGFVTISYSLISGIAGTYSVTVTDNNGCITTASVTITQPATAMRATVFTASNVSCNGGSNGMAKVSLTGGTLPYTYSWSPNSSSGYIASGLSAGTYSVTVTDNNGCSSTTLSTIISQPSVLRDSLVIVGTPQCNGETAGATIGVTGGASPYHYLWSPNVSTTATAVGLTTRGYVVQVKDANGCYNYVNFSISQPVGLRDSIVRSATVNVACNGANTGSATVGVKYGTAPYTYSWSSGGGTNATATGLSVGTYVVTVNDGGGCTVTASVSISGAGTMSATAFAGANISCNGGANGVVKASVSGGTSPYIYSWSPGSSSTYIASGLSVGTYTVTVSDNCGASATSLVALTQPASLRDSLATISYPLCTGGTGSATIGVSGGTSPYRYTWVPNVSTTATATGLTIRSYVVQVKDNNGCYNDLTFNISQPAALRDSIVRSATVNISCSGSNSGSATAGVKYGTAPYTYSWSPAGGNSATASGLSGGTYTVTVNDGGGCTATASVSITQPAALSPTAFIGTSISCNGGSNGVAKVSVSGGSIPYTYSWLSPASGSTYIASGLSAGTYMVTVSDNCGTSASSSVTVTEPAILSDSVITSSIISPPCSGGGTGSATIGVTGGTSPYRYTWSPNVSTTATGTGLTVRGYVVQVKDAKGCYNDITFNVTCSSAPATVTYNKENGASCCPSSDNINLYPNPNTGQFTLSGLQEGMILEMYDYTGKMISSMTATNESMQLNIFNQANGVYLIRILDKDGNLVSEKKVVKTQ